MNNKLKFNETSLSVNTESMDQILHSIFEPQNFRQMDWQLVPGEYKQGTDIFNQLSLDEVLFAATVSRWLYEANKQSALALKDYPEEVQNCVARSNNFLLYREQLETLFCLADGKRENARKFRRDWNIKRNEVRNELVSEMMIGEHSLKSIVEELCFDQVNYFVCGENYELANDFINTIRSWSSDPEAKSKFLGLGFIHYQGDTSSDKRPDITPDLRSVINLTIKDQENLWVEFNLEKDGIETTHEYNLLAEMKIQNDIYFMDPSFYRMRDTNAFIFSSQIVWLIDENPEHFEFTARYFGDLPTYLNVGEMY
jgi:hypothetical protein